MENNQNTPKKKGFFSGILGSGDMEDWEKEKDTTQKNLEALGKKYVTQLLKNLSRVDDDPTTQDLFTDGKIREYQEEVKKYGVDDDVVKLHNCIAQHIVKATESTLENSNSDQRYLTHIKTTILEFVGIADVHANDTLGVGLQKAVLCRIDKDLEKAASREYKSLCDKANVEGATEQDVLAPHQFLDEIDKVQAFRLTKLKAYLIKNHTKTQYVG